MAAPRFQVNGSGNWSATAHWGLTSGGSGGQSAPGAGNAAILDGNSGAVVTLDVNAVCQRFDARTFAGTVNGAGNITSGGDFKLGSGVTWSATGNVAIQGALAAIETAGKILPSLSFNGSTLTLLSDVQLSGAFTLVSGTVNYNGFTITENV